MKNRERLQSMALYDLLLKIANHGWNCPLKSLIPHGFTEQCRKYGDCRACLQDWLNEEEKQ